MPRCRPAGTHGKAVCLLAMTPWLPWCSLVCVRLPQLRPCVKETCLVSTMLHAHTRLTLTSQHVLGVVYRPDSCVDRLSSSSWACPAVQLLKHLKCNGVHETQNPAHCRALLSASSVHNSVAPLTSHNSSSTTSTRLPSACLHLRVATRPRLLLCCQECHRRADCAPCPGKQSSLLVQRGMSSS